MSIPTPEPGLVISYAYVWDREAKMGLEEGRKDRPCMIVLVVDRPQHGETVVTVLPVTHRPPSEPGAAVEMPLAVKQSLGLDDERSWVVVTEGDRFVWPGYDLRKVRGGDRWDFGFVPPRFFGDIVAAFRAWHAAHKVKLTGR